MFHRKNRQNNPELSGDGASSRHSSIASSRSSFSLTKAFGKVPTLSDDVVDDRSGSLGLNLLHSPSEPRIEFIFVHGLGGHSKKTWCKNSHYWPQEWLPQDPAFENLRIYSYGYDSNYLKGKEDCLNIHHIGKLLLGEISTSPSLANTNTPIVAIGHSMGGLIIKKAYILAKQDAGYMNVAKRFAAIYFLATPHRGADSAKMLKNILKVAYDRAYVADLGRNSSAIQVINDEFRHFSEGLELWSFYETQTMKWFSSPIVDPESAVLGYREEKQMPMNADHRSICKFESPLDANYLSLRNAFASTVGSITKTAAKTELKIDCDSNKILEEYLGLSKVLSDDLHTVQEARLVDSCNWITTKDCYLKWRDGVAGKDNVLWVSGKPATGKSVLAGYVIDQLRISGESSSYYFFKYGDKSKSGLGSALRTLAFQMACSNTEARDAILELQADGIRLETVDVRTFWRLVFLQSIFKASKTNNFWIIDGLDECSNSSALVEIILSNINETTPLRILITSRDTPDLNQSLFSVPAKFLQSLTISTEDTFPDLKLLIESKTETMAAVDPRDRPNLVEKILKESKGSFLWTTLVLEELLSCHSTNEVNRVLEEIPRGMEPLYKRTLTVMSQNARGKELAKAVLMWVACAVRPMTTNELNGALTLDIDDAFPNLEESIAALCGQLVSVDKFGRVQMVHETIREFLLSDRLESEFALVKVTAHTRMAQVCLRYLIGEEMKPPRTSRRRFLAGLAKKRLEFALYAVSAYSYHLSKADPRSADLLELLQQFFETNILTWIEAIADSRDLRQLVRTSKHLRSYLNACCVERSPLDPRIRDLRQWAADLIRIAAKFANALIASPSAIYSLIPPFCPTRTMIYGTNSQGRRLKVLGALNEQWDDRLFCIDSRQGQPISICYGDEFLAVGFSTGAVALYYASSYQEYKTLNHGEAVKIIRFRNKTDLMATCGLKTTKVWDIRSGEAVYNLESPQRPLDMAFDDSRLLVASHKNFVKCWSLGGSSLTEQDRPWCESANPGKTPSRRPPCALTISVSHRMLAVAYSGKPITLWDLEEDAYFGTCGKKLSTGENCNHLVVALVFNPNPSIGLLAVAYLDGDLALLDPFKDQQLECFRANCQALAASPNGRLLAAGAAGGVIHIYEFDTLRLLYKVKSSNSFIKQLNFSKDSMRLADIRGAQCTVWEPAALLRDTLSDDSSGTTSASLVDTVSLDPKANITVAIAGPKANLLICGRDDGEIVVYNRLTATYFGSLYSHKSPIRLLTWCETISALLSVDTSNRIFLYECRPSTDKHQLLVVDMLFQIQLESEKTIIDVLIGEAASKFVVSTRESYHLYTLDGTQVARRNYEDAQTIHKWIIHPESPLHAVCINNSRARIYSWKDCSEVGSYGLPLDSVVTQLKSLTPYTISQKQRILIDLSECDGPTKTSGILILDAEFLNINDGNRSPNQGAFAGTAPGGNSPNRSGDVETISSNFALLQTQVERLAHTIAHIIGVTNSGKFVFLDRSSWVCSMELKESQMKNYEYSRHFFVPYDWFAGRRDVVCGLAVNDVVFSRSGGLVIIRDWIDHAEDMTIEGQATGGKLTLVSRTNSAYLSR